MEREIDAILPIVINILFIIGVIMLIRRIGRSQLVGARSKMLDAGGANISSLFTPRNDTNTYSTAEQLRDTACNRLSALAKANGVDVIEQKSNAHSPEVWFRLDYLLANPGPNLSLRAYVEVVIERYDFHRFEHLYTVTASVGSETRRVSGVIDIDGTVSQQITHFILVPGSRLKIDKRVRHFPLEFWKPANKVKQLQKDWVNVGLTFVGVLGIILAIPEFRIPFVGPLLAIGAFAFLIWRNIRRRTYVLTSGKPMTDPRMLVLMDTWQANVPGLAGAAGAMYKGIVSRVRTGAPADLVVGVERIGYWGVDNRVERDQVVIRYRRAIGFLYLAAYGDNLYISWECHLNQATWVEQTLARGVDRDSGLNVLANRVVSGWQPVSEYDVADANFLAEWLHEAVKQDVKLRLTELKIDQEVDFTIQRESRKQAMEAGARRHTAAEKIKAGLNRFKRVG